MKASNDPEAIKIPIIRKSNAIDESIIKV